MQTIDAFLTAYEEELATHLKSDPEYQGITKTPAQIVQNMVQGVMWGYPKSDWYAYNQALKRAGLRVGIKTSKEFRCLFKVPNQES